MSRIATTLVSFVLLFSAACNSDTYSDEADSDEAYSEEAYSEEAYSDQPMSDASEPINSSFGNDRQSAAPASGNRVAILDHGFRMTRGTQIIPGDWKLEQDIATDPNTAKVVRNHLEMRGPGGELIKGLGIATYGQLFGTSFEQALHQLTTQGLGGEMQNISLGAVQRSAVYERTPEFQKAIRYGQERGFQVQALEVPIKGSRGGNPLRGVVYLGHFTYPNNPGTGTLQAMVVYGPPKSLDNALRIHEQIAHSYRANPEFEQRMMQANAAAMQRSNAQHEQMMAQSRAQHQQRMAGNQARFDAHQRMMQDQYNANDQQHAQWMDNFRNSGTSAWSGSDYSGHDAFVDGIHERSTFQDPYSGQQVSRDGQYDNWYNNGLGDYYGTDDPSFDPNSMDGNWERIEPLEPNP